MRLNELINDFVDDATGCKLFRGCKIRQIEETVEITVGFPTGMMLERLQSQLLDYLHEHHHLTINRVEIKTKIAKHQVQDGLKPHSHIKNIIAVASGKGGVGKSMVSVNLAAALSAQGVKVGVLDADIYGPSQSMMLGGAVGPESMDGKTMQPVIRHGMQTLSIGDLIAEDNAMIWRGPIVTQTLTQLFTECNWQDLDYLIIDLPPGTGDIQLTLAQRIPVSGAVVVTTPQDVALLDVKRAKAMFDKVHIPVLGLVENMSVFCCPHCGEETHVFGHDGGKDLAEEYDIPLLGTLPLDMNVRELSDIGVPICLAQPESSLAESCYQIGIRTAWALAQKAKSFSQIFSTVVVEK